MAIFGARNTTSVTMELVPGVNHTTSCLGRILCEFAEDMYKINSGMYISDIMMEEAALEGQDLTGVVENFITDLFDKVVDGLKKIWAKIKSWFASVKKWFQRIWLKGEEFIKKFKNEILEKRATGFEYEGYEYNFGNGNKIIADVRTKAEEVATKVATNLKHTWEEHKATLTARAGGDSAVDMKKRTDEKFETDKDWDTAVKTITGTYGTETKMHEAATKAYRGGSDDKKTIKNWSGTSASAMCEFILKLKEETRSFDEDEKAFDDMLKECISALEQAKDEFKDQGEKTGYVGSVVNHQTSILKRAITFYSAAMNVKKNAYSTAAAEYESVLKKWLSYKPAKEANASYASGFESNGTGSLLENAMKLV
jgi:hypothetical protein